MSEEELVEDLSEDEIDVDENRVNDVAELLINTARLACNKDPELANLALTEALVNSCLESGIELDDVIEDLKLIKEELSNKGSSDEN